MQVKHLQTLRSRNVWSGFCADRVLSSLAVSRFAPVDGADDGSRRNASVATSPVLLARLGGKSCRPEANPHIRRPIPTSCACCVKAISTTRLAEVCRDGRRSSVVGSRARIWVIAGKLPDRDRLRLRRVGETPWPDRPCPGEVLRGAHPGYCSPTGHYRTDRRDQRHISWPTPTTRAPCRSMPSITRRPRVDGIPGSWPLLTIFGDGPKTRPLHLPCAHHEGISHDRAVGGGSRATAQPAAGRSARRRTVSPAAGPAQSTPGR